MRPRRLTLNEAPKDATAFRPEAAPSEAPRAVRSRMVQVRGLTPNRTGAQVAEGGCARKMVRPRGLTSNLEEDLAAELFQTLSEWEQLLQAENIEPWEDAA